MRPPQQRLQAGSGHADTWSMKCTRCGADGAVENRGTESFCVDCAPKRDWQELIALVQDAHVATPVAGGRPALRSA